MIFGFPVEIITMLGSGLFSGIMTMWGMKAKAEAEFRMHALKANKQQHQQTIENIKVDPGFSFTRRVVTFIIVTGAMIAVFFPTLFGVPTLIELTSESEGFFGLFKNTTTTYETVNAFVTPEWLKHAMLSIVGLYFGNSIVKK